MNKIGFLISMTAFWIPELCAQSVSTKAADTAKVVTACLCTRFSDVA